jgi:hypothetical protein
MRILIESMTLFEFDGYKIRCWRQEKKAYDEKIETETKIELGTVLEPLEGKKLTMFQIAVALLDVERMNAVEVLNQMGQGCVLYKNWP